MRLLFLADTSVSSGLGHLNRCLVLAEAMHDVGVSVQVIGCGGWLAQLPGQSKVPVVWLKQLISAADLPDADACVVDLYEYDNQFYRVMGEKYKRIVMFDDVDFRIPERVDAVINTNIYANSTIYSREIISFAGPQYYLLRSEFTAQPPAMARGANLLICMGGSDPEGQSRRVVAAARQRTERQIDLVLGASCPEQADLDFFAASPRVTLHRSVSQMRPLMEQAAYAVSGAGTLLYELAYLGIPAACLSLAENQRKNAEAFAARSAAINIGVFEQVTDDDIICAVERMETEAGLRERLSTVACAVIDGNGTRRLASDLIAWLAGC